MLAVMRDAWRTGHSAFFRRLTAYPEGVHDDSLALLRSVWPESAQQQCSPRPTLQAEHIQWHAVTSAWLSAAWSGIIAHRTDA